MTEVEPLRLDYAPAWAMVGLAAEHLHDALTEPPSSGGVPAS